MASNLKALVELKEEKLSILRKLKRLSARENLIDFAEYVKPEYDAQDFHLEICKVMDRFNNGELKKVAIFLPPQHGKSELSSRLLPSYLLGRNPDRRIALCSYGAEHAQSFNRDVQRVIDNELYFDVFPETTLNESNVSTTSKKGFKRTANIFEVVDKNGFFKTVGVGGALTGTTVDIGIIDDVYSNREQANSETIRKKVWSWYTDVFESRLHNESQQLILFTRWHDDDLGGRVIKRDGTDWQKNGWFVVTYRALKEQGDEKLNPFIVDSRETGEALWQNRHSKDRLEAIKKDSPLTFNSLYQQRPSVKGGNIIKSDWFLRYDSDFLKVIRYVAHNYIDTATSTKEQKNNDPTGILTYTVVNGIMYVLNFEKGMWGFPEQCEVVKIINKVYCDERESINHIENKSNGASLKQHLQSQTNLNFSMDNPRGTKVERLILQTGRIKSGRVALPKNESWVDSFLDTITRFPKVAHDEEVDCLTGAMRKAFDESDFRANNNKNESQTWKREYTKDERLVDTIEHKTTDEANRHMLDDY